MARHFMFANIIVHARNMFANMFSCEQDGDTRLVAGCSKKTVGDTVSQRRTDAEARCVRGGVAGVFSMAEMARVRRFVKALFQWRGRPSRGIKRIFVAGGGKSKKKQRMDCLLNDVLTDEKLRARVLKFLIYFGVTDEVYVCKHTSVYLQI